jgi:Kdo2-lipid IVA lauroyltransferase/acyltransferase
MKLLFIWLSRLPMPALYAFGRGLGFVLFTVLRVRTGVVADNMKRAFPELDEATRRKMADDYHREVMDVSMEMVKGFTLPVEVLRERVVLDGLQPLLDDLAGGRSVMVVTAHHCNWEWLLLRLTEAIPYPVEALYKPLQPASAEKAMRAMRGRFGGRLVPAKDVLTQVLSRRGEGARVLALVADQVPLSAPNKIWLRFLGLDTAFYAGTEEISRALQLPVYFLAMERTARGHYKVAVESLTRPGDGSQRPGETTKRYARRLEAHLRKFPVDWFWGHRRWKLKKPLYGK